MADNALFDFILLLLVRNSDTDKQYATGSRNTDRSIDRSIDTMRRLSDSGRLRKSSITFADIRGDRNWENRRRRNSAAWLRPHLTRPLKEISSAAIVPLEQSHQGSVRNSTATKTSDTDDQHEQFKLEV